MRQSPSRASSIDRTAAEAVGKTRADVMAEMRAQLHALPADQFPQLVRAADDPGSDDPEALFEFGLDLVIRGLAPLARRGG